MRRGHYGSTDGAANDTKPLGTDDLKFGSKRSVQVVSDDQDEINEHHRMVDNWPNAFTGDERQPLLPPSTDSSKDGNNIAI